jgi:hypothetical protein
VKLSSVVASLDLTNLFLNAITVTIRRLKMANITLTTEQLTDDLILKLYNTGVPVMLEGSIGIGKTEMVVDASKRLSLGIVVEMLTAYDAPDVGGYMIPTKDANGTPVTITTEPTWLRRINEQIAAGYSKGILYFDEYKQAGQLVRKAAAQLKSAGEINGHKIPQGWMIFMSGNRSNDKSGVERPMAHDTNRQCTIEVVPSQMGFLKWATNKGINPFYAAFVQQFPQVVLHGEPSADPAKPTCTPRSLMYAHKFHTAGYSVDDELPSDVVTQTVVAGYIGQAAAAELFGFLKVREFLPTKDEILADPLAAKLPPSNRLDAAYAVSQLICYYADAKTIDPLFTYAERLPRELQVSVAQQLVAKSGGVLLNSAKLSNWIGRNSALITNTLA